MPQTDHDRAIALAGVLQAADLVRGIARRGQANAEDVDTCLASLLKIDAPSSVDVYGDLHHLHSGLRLLEQQLGNPRDMELTRYAVALLGLERKLSRRADLLSALGDLSEAQRLASARDCDWAWAQERLREGKTVTHPALWPHDDSPDFPPRIRRIGVDPDVVYKLETACTRAHFAKLNFPGTVGWRVVEPPPSGDHA